MDKYDAYIFGLPLLAVPAKCLDYLQGCVATACGGVERVENKDGSFSLVTPIDHEAKSNELIRITIYAMCLTTRDSYMRGWIDATNEYTDLLREKAV